MCMHSPCVLPCTVTSVPTCINKSVEYFCTYGTMYKPCARIATLCAE